MNVLRRAILFILIAGGLIFLAQDARHARSAAPDGFTVITYWEKWSGREAEQMRQIATFAQLLERMDIHVDAVLDLTDLQVKGALSNKTRFLVLGDPAVAKDTADEGRVVDPAPGATDRRDEVTVAVVEAALHLVEKSLLLLGKWHSDPSIPKSFRAAMPGGAPSVARHCWLG